MSEPVHESQEASPSDPSGDPRGNPPGDPRTNPRAPTATRLLSLLAVAVIFVLYQPGAPVGIVNSFVLPALGAVAAWFLARSVLVITLSTALLAGARVDLSSTHWYESVLAPALAVVATSATVVLLLLRFRDAVRARRAQRMAERAGSATDEDLDGQP